MSENPLSEYFKKPGIYVKLPSEGNYYDDDINLTSTGEANFPVATRDGLKIAYQKADWEGWERGVLQVQDVAHLTKSQALP